MNKIECVSLMQKFYTQRYQIILFCLVFLLNKFSFHTFQITYSTGRPFALQNCSVSNQSSDSLQVECEPGFDGGLPQQFLLELVEMPALKLARNLSLQVSV